MTLKIIAPAAVGSALLAFLVALGRLSRHAAVRWLCAVFTELFRAVPLLLLLILVYYGLGGDLAKVGIGPFLIVVVVLILNEGAYTAEVYRGALLSIDRGQWQAGASLGLSYMQTLRLVVLPQFVRIALPPTVNMLVYVIKGSAFASLITVSELTLDSQQLVSSTFQPLQIYLIAGALYLIVTVPLGYLVYFIGGERSAEGHIKAPSRRPRISLTARLFGAGG